ncbi:hypothetical protein EVAR_25306_1 [Eumeta japonica]|uniref:Uncharacterized protein n=1 Tax=Eumeta variegata TaxID=151549 RepID=A0A4C1VP55_EUMVA|nr:hypothetical protein EVAR_25306_1 [Eumeta japonica]
MDRLLCELLPMTLKNIFQDYRRNVPGCELGGTLALPSTGRIFSKVFKCIGIDQWSDRQKILKKNEIHRHPLDMYLRTHTPCIGNSLKSSFSWSFGLATSVRCGTLLTAVALGVAVRARAPHAPSPLKSSRQLQRRLSAHSMSSRDLNEIYVPR